MATNHLKGERLNINKLDGEAIGKAIEELVKQVLLPLEGQPLWACNEILNKAIKIVNTTSLYQPPTSS